MASPPAVQSSLVLFFGVDLVGSTAFKAKNRLHAWLPVFMGFYYQFRARLTEAVQTEKKNDALAFGEDPVFWKAAGDELLFTKSLTDAKQAWRTIRTFRKAVLTYRDELQEKQPNLDVKAYAWIAGFPILNARIPMGDGAKDLDIEGEPPIVAYRLEQQISKETARSTDYLGPSIDLGFRLGKFAERRKFVVSADLAYLLCDQDDRDDRDIKFWYEGRQPLKGVLGDRPYPVFWIDMNSGSVDDREDSMLQGKDIARREVRDFCKTFLEDTAGAFCLPYIVGSTSASGYSSIPKEHQEALRVLREHAAAEAERDSAPLKRSSEGGDSMAAPTVATALSSFLSGVNFKGVKKRPQPPPVAKTKRGGAGKKN